MPWFIAVLSVICVDALPIGASANAGSEAALRRRLARLMQMLSANPELGRY